MAIVPFITTNMSQSQQQHQQQQDDDDNNNINNTIKGDDNDDDDDHEHDMVMPGFRFHPTEEELVEFYLRRKVEGKRFNVELITFLDLYRYDPWELPGIYYYSFLHSFNFFPFYVIQADSEFKF